MFGSDFKLPSNSPVNETGLLSGFSVDFVGRGKDKNDKPTDYITMRFSRDGRSISKNIFLENSYAKTKEEKTNHKNKVYAQLFELAVHLNSEDFLNPEINPPTDDFELAVKFTVSFIEANKDKNTVSIVSLADSKNPSFTTIPSRPNSVGDLNKIFIYDKEKQRLTLEPYKPNEETSTTTPQPKDDMPF